MLRERENAWLPEEVFSGITPYKVSTYILSTYMMYAPLRSNRAPQVGGHD